MAKIKKDNSLNITEYLFNLDRRWIPIIKSTEQSIQVVTNLSKQLDLYNSSPQNSSTLLIDQVVHWTLNNKKWHIIAGNVLSKNLSGQNRKKFIEVMSLLQILLVDLSDTLGDYGGLRKFEQSRKIYSVSENIFSTHFKNPFKNDDQLKKIGELLLKISKEIKFKFKQIPEHRIVSKYIYKIVRDYGWCVSVMHIQDEKERKKTALEYYKVSIRNNGRKPIEWIPPEIWYEAQGSPVGIGGILYELIRTNGKIKIEALNDIYYFYEQAIPLLHVWLDDLNDIDEDYNKKDINLFNEIINNRIKDFKSPLNFTMMLCDEINKRKAFLEKNKNAHNYNLKIQNHIELMTTMIKVYETKFYISNNRNMPYFANASECISYLVRELC